MAATKIEHAIRKTPDVCGGSACVRDTRIAVWTLWRLKELGRTEPQLLGDYPDLTARDLEAAWDYARQRPDEIRDAIARQGAPPSGTARRAWRCSGGRELRPAVVRRLRALGHDVLTASEAGMANRRVPDELALEYATRLGRAVLTFDWDDFVALHDRGVAHAGIVACEVDADPDALAARIDLAAKGQGSLANRFIGVRT